jgi:glutathione S-transferase
MSDSELKLYVDYMSQPSRAVMLFCYLSNIPFQPQLIQIAKGETRSSSYAKVNPMRKVPAMVDRDGFTLFESHTIMRYLADSRKVDERWYPRADLKARALIDQFLDWHHGNIRAGSAGYLFNKYIAGRLGIPVDKDAQEKGWLLLNQSLKILERILESDKRKYLSGSSQATIADLSIFCEIDQHRMGDLEGLLAKYPLVKEWYQRVLETSGDHYQNVAKILNKVSKASKL